MSAITEAGLYDGMPDDVYHGDPVPGGSLSSTGARTLVTSTPAHFRWEADHGRPEKREFDFGHAAHREVLGVGADLVIVQAADWRTKAAQEQRAAAYAEGKTPILQREHETVREMAAALRRHPLARALFDPDRGGRPEQSGFWRDEQHEVWRRVRFDWLPPLTAGGRLLVADYKSCVSADPRSVAKTIGNLGYHQQGAWYEDAARALDLADDVRFLFVFQEKTPPFLVSVVQVSEQDMEAGRARNRKALDLYAQCQQRGVWPGYGEQVHYVSLPPWQQNLDTELAA